MAVKPLIILSWTNILVPLGETARPMWICLPSGPKNGVVEMRLFIAINPNNDTRSRLLSLRDELKARSRRGSFVAPDNLHLTLAFLDECDEEATAEAKLVMDSVTVEPFALNVESLGRFRRQGGDIWWAGLREDKALLDLQRSLTDRLVAAGFALDRRRYSPHITLARQVVTDAMPWRIEPFGETARIIDLMKSERINGKLTYTSIYRRGKWEKPIVVERYDPKWAQEFRRIRDFLSSHLDDLIVDIHHVGSTSVVGLAAKPIIDLDIEIESMGVFPGLLTRLERLGYRHKGDYGIQGREVIKRDRADDFMQYHMYVCPSDSRELKRHVAFRDYLRSHPAAVREYGELKRGLAAAHGNDIDAYIDGKTQFIETILRLRQ